MVRLSHPISILHSYPEGGDQASLSQGIQKQGLASWPKALCSRLPYRAHRISLMATKGLLTRTVK
jgi:hypothetical protein